MRISADDLRALGPRGKQTYIDALAKAAPDILPLYEITTPLRVCHFWAQAAHECDRFKTMGEYWGPTPAQKRYEGRKDLGNTHPGDGYRFRGRGIFQLTGRATYEQIGKRLGIDLVKSPDVANDPVTALRIACEYWKSRNLNALADKNDLPGITKKINGGANGIADRRAAFATAWNIWGAEDKPPAPAKTITQSKTANTAIASGSAATIGLGAAYEAGKEAVKNASEIKEAATGAASLFGLSSGFLAVAIGCAVIVVAGCAFIWWERRRKLKTEGI